MNLSGNLNDYCRVCFVERYESSDAEERGFLRDILAQRNNVEDIEDWFGNILIEIHNLNLNMRAAILNSMNFDDIHSDIIEELELVECPECKALNVADEMATALCKTDEPLCTQCSIEHTNTCKDCDNASKDMVHRSTSTKVLTM